MRFGRLGWTGRYSIGLALGVTAGGGHVVGCSDEATPSGGARSATGARATEKAGWQEREPGQFALKMAGARAVANASSLRLDWGRTSPASNDAPALTLVSIGRGDQVSAIPASTAVSGPWGLRIDRGTAVERLEAARGSVEQSWSFAQRPSGEGDLVVRLRTSGMQVRSFDERGLRFNAGARDVRYSKAKWIDAHGQEWAVKTRYARGEIVLEVPADVVDASAYPAVLDPTISTELLLSEPRRVPGGYVSGIALDCNATQCLMTWAQDGAIAARRANLDGSWLDDPVLVLGAALGAPTVSSTPTKHQVTWRGLDDLGDEVMLGVEVDAATGAVSDVPPVVLTDAPALEGRAAAYAGGVHLVVYEDYNDQHRTAFRLVDNALQTPTSGIDLGAPTSTKFALAAGSNQFAWVEGNELQRIDSTDGDILDATPIVYSTWGYSQFTGKTAITYDGANYVLVWFEGSNLFAARVRASDGVLLDPDDDFNELPGARVLCASGGAVHSISIAGGKLYVGYQVSGTNAVAAASFDMAPWTSSSTSCPASVVHYEIPMPTPHIEQAGASGVAILQYSDGMRSFGYAIDSSGLANPTNKQILNYYSPLPQVPFVVSNGRDFTLSGQDVETDDAIVQQIDGVTGESRAVDLGGLKAFPNAAASGDDYLLVYGNKARRLSCGGDVGPEKTLPAGQMPARLAGDGTRYYVLNIVNSFNLNGYRVDADGNYLEQPKPLGFGSGYWFHAGLAADRTPTPDMRTFVAIVRTETDVQAFRIRSATGSMLAPIAVTDTDIAAAAITVLSSDGTNMLVAWDKWIDNQTPNQVWGASFNPINGAVTGEKQLTPPIHGELSFDGTSHLDSWYDSQLHVRRFDSSFTSADAADGFTSAAYQESIGSNQYGRSLIVSRQARPEFLGYVYVGHFIDNELSGEDPDDAPVQCLEGGAGGAGSESSGGAAGADTGGSGGSGGTSVGAGGTPEGGASAGGAPDGSGGNDDATGGMNGEAGVNGGGGTPDVGGSGGNGGDAGGAMVPAAGRGGAPAGGGAGNTMGGEALGGSAQGGTAGSSASAGSKDSGGCGCRTVPASPNAPWHVLLGTLALIMRRRRAAKSPR